MLLEGLGFNLCVVPFLNVCVPNLPQGSKTEFGWRCHTRDGQERTKSEGTVKMKTSED